MKDNRVRDHWRQQALRFGDSPEASWSDLPMLELETRTICHRLKAGEHVLDAGCANGWGTIEYARTAGVRVTGIDYVPEMVETACRRLAGEPRELRERVDFQVGDVMGLELASATFDLVVAKRVIINLGDFASQLRAVRECARVLKPGGRLLLSEATRQGWERLNRFRREWGLTDIPMPEFNFYLDADRLPAELRGELELESRENFASTYYVGTRIIKPLLARALGSGPAAADPSCDWNRWFSTLPAWGDYGIQELLVFRKTGERGHS